MHNDIALRTVAEALIQKSDPRAKELFEKEAERMRADGWGLNVTAEFAAWLVTLGVNIK